MAQQWGDPNRVRNQIDSARAEGNRNILIEKNGWKSSLADSLNEYGLAAQKQAYLERNRADKRVYDRGVLEDARGREDTLLSDKQAYAEGKADDALILEDEISADAQLEVPTTAAGQKRKDANRKGVLGNQKTEAEIGKLSAETSLKNRTDPNKSKSNTSSMFVDGQGNPVSKSDLDIKYKLAVKQLPSDVQEAIKELNLEEIDELAAMPTEQPGSDWFGANQDYGANKGKQAIVKSDYAKKRAALDIVKILEGMGVYSKGSQRSTAPASGNKETIQERMKRINSGG